MQFLATWKFVHVILNKPTIWLPVADGGNANVFSDRISMLSKNDM